MTIIELCPQCNHSMLQHDIRDQWTTCTITGCLCHRRIPGEPVVYATVKQQTLHYSTDKSAVDQIPPSVLFMIADVFSYGEKKYGRDNWKKGTCWHEFIGSTLRHFYKFCQGEWMDPESNLPHLAHSMVNITFLIYYHDHGLGTDDRDSNA